MTHKPLPAGNSRPGTGKTHAGSHGGGLRAANSRALSGQRGCSAQMLDWLAVEEITQLDMALWADLACVGRPTPAARASPSQPRPGPGVLTCRASTSARAPAARTPRNAARGCRRVPEEAALPVHLALHVLALGADLDGALQLALKLGAGGPRKGLLEDDHVVDALCSTSSVHSSRLVLLESTRPPSWPRRPGSCRAPTAPPRPPCTPARPDGSPLWT